MGGHCGGGEVGGDGARAGGQPRSCLSASIFGFWEVQGMMAVMQLLTLVTEVVEAQGPALAQRASSSQVLARHT